MSITLRRSVVMAVAALVLGAATASADVHWYLYSIGIRSGEPRYAREIPVGQVIKAAYAEVETDSLGRLIRATWYWGGKRTSETRYLYSAGGRLPDSFDNYAATGELTGRSRIQRNAAGDRTRIDTFTTTGTLTGYAVRNLGAESVESLSYTAEGKRTGRTVSYYSPAGVLVRVQSYPEDNIIYESDYDPGTGLAQARRKLVSGKVESTNKYTYDSYGDRIRDDIYTADGTWYGAREYAENLQTAERYKFTDGSSQEVKFAYDENRRLATAVFSRNSQLICTFKYDRLPTGAVKRTLAVGPDGQLYAEYPDLVVTKVEQNGHPVDHPDAGVLHRKGNWW
jgi:hypothetical protein